MNLAYDSLDDLIVVAAPSLAYDSLDDLVVIALDDYDPSEPRDKSGEWTKGSEPSRVEHTQYGDVQVNPGPTELKGVFNKLRGTREYRDVPTLRVLGHEGNLYAWPSGQAIHDDMATELGIGSVKQPMQVGWYVNGLKHLTTINEDKAEQFGYDLRKAWIAAGNPEAQVIPMFEDRPQARDDFNPSEPRVPEGQPGGGEWTAGGSTEGVVAPIDPEVANVGGDEWNKATAKRLALEYAKAKPALEAIAKEIGRMMKLSDMTSEEQALFKMRYLAKRSAEYKESMLKTFPNSGEASYGALADQKAFFNDPKKKADWLLAQAAAFYGRLPGAYKVNLAKDGLDAQKLADCWYLTQGTQWMAVSLKEDAAKIGGPDRYDYGHTQQILDDLRFDLNLALKADWQKRKTEQKPEMSVIEKHSTQLVSQVFTQAFQPVANGNPAVFDFHIIPGTEASTFGVLNPQLNGAPLTLPNGIVVTAPTNDIDGNPRPTSIQVPETVYTPTTVAVTNNPPAAPVAQPPCTPSDITANGVETITTCPTQTIQVQTPQVQTIQTTVASQTPQCTPSSGTVGLTTTTVTCPSQQITVTQAIPYTPVGAYGPALAAQ